MKSFIFYGDSTHIIRFLDHAAFQAIVPMAVLFFIFGLDDFIIDLCAYVLKVKPSVLTSEEQKTIQSLPEKRIAVLVAAWKEHGVLKNMIRGNLATINYQNYSFFIGVYPNDLATLQEARELASQNSQVHVIVNSMEGPTCKGQMLNVLVRCILRSSRETGVNYDAFIVHDSEDLIHKEEFKLVNKDLDRYDFIQVPIFSLPVSPFSLVAGIYIDEFSEAHTKSVLVRNRLGAAIPSAGVGTALSRKFVLACLKQQAGDFMNTKSLTEDYELGLSTHAYGVSSKLSCYYLKLEGNQKDFIATREYFPKSIRASIRQKSRWTLGIAFQGTEHLGWKGDGLHKYFLFRDRKGPVCNVLVLFAFFIFFYSVFRERWYPGFQQELFGKGPVLWLLQINIFFMINRMLQRVWCVQLLYGWKLAILAPIRWPLANIINFLATYHATKQYLESKILGTVPKWIKTEHELPEGFGVARDMGLEEEFEL